MRAVPADRLVITSGIDDYLKRLLPVGATWALVKTPQGRWHDFLRQTSLGLKAKKVMGVFFVLAFRLYF